MITEIILPLLGGAAFGVLCGYATRWCVGWVFAWRERRKSGRIAATQIHWGAAFPIIHEWARREHWYLQSNFLNQAAQLEHMRLMRDEPELTLEENLAKVAANIRTQFPGAFETLH